MNSGFVEGIELFNRGEFFAAHEVLEDVWRACTTQDKTFLQGLVQLAVALHHHSTGNVVGAASLLAKSRRNLEGYPTPFHGVDLGSLLATVERWQEAMDERSQPPPAPQISLDGASAGPD